MIRTVEDASAKWGRDVLGKSNRAGITDSLAEAGRQVGVEPCLEERMVPSHATLRVHVHRGQRG